MTVGRIVPVTLREGKQYILRDGTRVVVAENPHWQCRAQYPFINEAGTWFMSARGEVTPGCAHEKDVVRPVYTVGEWYKLRNGGVVRLRDSGDSCYPLDGGSHTWTPEGAEYEDTESRWDIMDYADPPAEQVVATPVPSEEEEGMPPTLPPVSPPDDLIGRRVWCPRNLCGGVVKGVDSVDGMVAVEFDQPPDGGHSCGGLCTDTRGWWYFRGDVLSILSDDVPTPPVEQQEATLSEEDKALIWQAFSNKPIYPIDYWITARRQLLAQV